MLEESPKHLILILNAPQLKCPHRRLCRPSSHPAIVKRQCQLQIKLRCISNLKHTSIILARTDFWGVFAWDSVAVSLRWACHCCSSLAAASGASRTSSLAKTPSRWDLHHYRVIRHDYLVLDRRLNSSSRYTSKIQDRFLVEHTIVAFHMQSSIITPCMTVLRQIALIHKRFTGSDIDYRERQWHISVCAVRWGCRTLPVLMAICHLHYHKYFATCHLAFQVTTCTVTNGPIKLISKTFHDPLSNV